MLAPSQGLVRLGKNRRAQHHTDPLMPDERFKVDSFPNQKSVAHNRPRTAKAPSARHECFPYSA